jgi:hypothetical protein
MIRTQRGAVTWAAGSAVLLSILVPDFRYDLYSVAVILFVAPVAIAWPVLTSSVRTPQEIPITRAVLIVIAGLFIHSVVGLAIYALGVGHIDPVSWSILVLAFLSKVILSAVVWLFVWGIHAIRRSRQSNAL